MGELIGAHARAMISPDLVVKVPVRGAPKAPKIMEAAARIVRKYISLLSLLGYRSTCN